MRQLNISKLKQKWIKLKIDESDEVLCEMLLRPFPITKTMTQVNHLGSNYENNWEVFDYSVLDWKNYGDENGAPLVFNDKNKRQVFDFDAIVVLAVFKELSSWNSDILVQKKT